ncbi:hypothetical protein [Brevibacillus laterosporus]|uniref:Asparagine synthase n=1 Tax=Brevibacillus laterosporus TaxID=1465 RepID=A0AAP3GBS4_BRELA|nr:hypothetical protein [Brevibacillus laterosporus]MCR8980310.1 hypothetical protein [Brevibacillus laterosporus]MCZ0807465.1 hypothetical protein [Brevibacillus laterosporus]MCZ0825901.1 hypothetical protein [Brevibacillus laterosporus]MCZ0849587.1 hypothetical protein [Brevibacillus laterosporus]MED1663604.1 hypothetical protein [Brevibacillus laterosporus]
MPKGIVPIILGTIVTAGGLSFVKTKYDHGGYTNPYAWGVAGFGLAHIVLGTIDALRD